MVGRGFLRWILDVDADAVVKEPVGTVDVEVGYTLLLNDSVGFDCERFCVPCDANFARGCWMKVVDLFSSLIADLGSGVGGFT